MNTGKFGGVALQALALTRDLTETLRPGVNPGIPMGSQNGNCPLGGSLRTQLSNDRLRLTETFNNCVSDVGAVPATINGVQQTVYSGPTTGQRFTVTVTFENLTVVAGGITETLNGTASYTGGPFNTPDTQESMTLNAVIDNNREGTLTLSNVVFDFLWSVDFLNNLTDVNGASGQIAQSVQGRVDLGYDATENLLLVSGDGPNVGAIEFMGSRLAITLRSSVNGPALGFIELDLEDVRDTEFFNDSNRFGPLRISTTVSDLRNILALQQDTLEFSLRRNFADGDGDLLTIDLDLLDVTLSNRDRQTEVLAPDDPRVDFTLAEPAAGIYRVTSATDAEVVGYRFEAYANDPTGLRSLDPLDVSFAIYRDTDLDGDADRFDDDDDNDTVIDVLDEFPLDPTESEDFDRDGIGDNADPDDDNDGTPDVNDAYPFDGACFLASDGDGTGCFLSRLNTRSSVTVDRDGIVYIYDFDAFVLGGTTIRRYDTGTGHFLSPIDLDPSLVGLTPEQGSFRVDYVEGHHALYISYGQAPAITKIDLSDPNLTETVLRNPSQLMFNPIRDVDFGDYAVRRGDSSDYVSFDANGNDVSTYVPMNISDSLAFVAPAAAAFCQEGFTLNPLDGTFIEISNPNGYNCRVFGEPLISPDGALAATGQLEIIDQSITTVATFQPQERARTNRTWRWSTDGLFVVSGLGVEVFDDDGTPITVVQPSGTPPSILELTVLQRRNFILIVFRNTENGIEILRYTPP